MKGKGRTVVIHPPRSIRRTFLGRVVSGRAGGGGRRRIDPIHHGGIYIHPSPLSLSKAVFPRSLPFLSIPPGPSPASRRCFSPARPAYAAAFVGVGALARNLQPPLPSAEPTLPQFSTPFSSSPLSSSLASLVLRGGRCNHCLIRVKSNARKRNTINTEECVALVKSGICVKMGVYPIDLNSSSMKWEGSISVQLRKGIV